MSDETLGQLDTLNDHVKIDRAGWQIDCVDEALDGVVFSSFTHVPTWFEGQTQEGFVLCLNGTAHYQAGTYGDQRLERRLIAANDVSIAGPAMPFEVECFDEKTVTTRYVWLTEARLRALLPISFQGRLNFNSLYGGHFKAPLVAQLLRALFGHAGTGSALGALYTEVMMTAVIAELLQINQTPIVPKPARPNDLTPAQLRRIADYVDASDNAAISSERLAALVNMSPSRFLRSFKAATNSSPYQFILTRRVERARAMLYSSNRSLAQIALDCGFSSQSHMTDIFRSRLNVTPGALRRSLRD
ncbi:MAG: AraC family transcriptional regulator [Pseudomonadota bacterium]